MGRVRWARSCMVFRFRGLAPKKQATADKTSGSVHVIWTQLGIFPKNASLEWKNKGNKHRQVVEFSDWKVIEKGQMMCENMNWMTIRWKRFPKLLNFSKKTTCMNAMKKVFLCIQIERKMRIPDLLQKMCFWAWKTRPKVRPDRSGNTMDLDSFQKNWNAPNPIIFDVALQSSDAA